MSEICNDCGLPQELCACTDIEKNERGDVSIGLEDRRYDKQMTVVKGVVEDDLDTVESELKSAVGAGGTIEDGVIYIQGDHKSSDNFRQVLESHQYNII